MRKYYFIFLLLLFCNCKIQGELKGLYSYYDKTKRSHPELLVQTSDTTSCSFAQPQKPQVCIVNGRQLRHCLEQSNNAVVYLWSPLCQGDKCYALELIQRECENKNMDLFVVAEYYDGKKMSADYSLNRSILGIDTQFYRTNLCEKYVRLFYKDLIGQQANGRFVQFRNGLFVRMFDDLAAL